MAAGILKGVIDLRPGEGRTVALVAGLLALLIGAHTMLETARDALFLAKLPPSRLTFVYVALAVLSLLVGSASSALARRFGRKAALVLSLLVAAYATSVLYLRPATPTMVFGFYLLSGVIGTVLVLQFWMYTSQLFTVAQGKRLFGPIASGGVVGATIGAALAAGLLRVIHVKSLLLVGSAIFVVAAAVLASGPAEQDAPSSREASLAGLRGFGVLRKEPYVARVAILTALGTATVLVVDYLFKSVAAATMPKHELGQFFASFYAAQNALSLLVQLFLTSRIVSRLGVPAALSLLPLLLTMGGTTSFLLAGGLVAVLLSKGADGALRNSLHRVTSELLLLPLSTEVRGTAKPLLDTVFGRGVQALVAGVIFVAAGAGLATPRRLGAAVAVLAFLWLASAIAIRRSYVDLFRRALSLGTLAPDPTQGELDLESVEALLESLSSPEEQRALAALEILEYSHRPRLVPALVLLHESPKVLERALGIVADGTRTDWVPHAERLLSHPDVTVRAAVVRALAGSETVSEASLERCLEDPSEIVRAEAVFFLAKRRETADPRVDPRVRAVLDARGEAGAQARTALLSVIAEHGDERWLSVVEAAIEGDRLAPASGAVVAGAIRKMGDTRFLPLLVSRLALRDGRSSAREAIVSLGDAGYEAVARAMDDPSTDPRVRLHLPRTLSRFASQRAVDDLTRRLTSEENGAVRYKILRGLGRLAADGTGASGERLRFDRGAFEGEVEKSLREHFRLMSLAVALRRADAETHRGTGVSDVLLELLDDKTRQSLERAFRFLGLAHRNEDIRGVYDAVRHGDRRARANALEFLDALTVRAPTVRALFKVVADDLGPGEQVRRVAGLLSLHPPTSGVEALRRLISDADELLAALSAYASLDLGLIELRADVTQALSLRPRLFMLGQRSPDSARGERRVHG